MPKISYTEEEKTKVHQSLIDIGYDLISQQGIQHTTVEQIYKRVGISKTFFYSFFPTKEDLIVEILYKQQPKIIQFAQTLIKEHPWRQGVELFLYQCCYGAKYGITILTIEEQQMIFRRLTKESYIRFRNKQKHLFANLLICFGIEPTEERVSLFINLCLSILVLNQAIPSSLPLLIPEAAEQTIVLQIQALTDWLDTLRK